MIGITGKRSAITQEFLKLIKEEPVFGSTETLPTDLDTYLLCSGVLVGKRLTDMTDAEVAETFKVNFTDIARFCDRVFETNPQTRICVIGSYSGYKGSYDMAYAGSKAALHLYVETKRLLEPEQHLVCIAPTIIEDAGMTLRRSDLKDVEEQGKSRRMKRWPQAAEIARIAHTALQEPTLANTVIKLTGGTW